MTRGALMFDREKFVWRGLALHYGRRKTPVLILVADATFPHLYRIPIPKWLDEHAGEPDAREGRRL